MHLTTPATHDSVLDRGDRCIRLWDELVHREGSPAEALAVLLAYVVDTVDTTGSVDADASLRAVPQPVAV